MPIVVDLLFVNVGNARAIINNIGIDFNVADVKAQLPGNLEPPSFPYIPIRECGFGVHNKNKWNKFANTTRRR